MANNENDKLDWMYKGAQSQVDREDYLLGKSVDKAFEQLTNEEKEKKLGIVPPKNHVEHECIPPSIRDYNKIVQQEQVDLSAKLQEDPLVAIKKQEEEARRQFLQNPIQLKKLQEALMAQEVKKKKKKKHKKKKESDSEEELDKKIAEKLKKMKQKSTDVLKREKKKKSDDHLDVILMHKFNQLKDKLSQEDLDDILNGKSSSSEDEHVKSKKSKKYRSSSSSSESDRSVKEKYKKNNSKHKNDYKPNKFKKSNERNVSRDTRKRNYSSSSSDGDNDRKKDKKDYFKDKNKYKYKPSTSFDKRDKKERRKDRSRDRNERKRDRSIDRNEKRKSSPKDISHKQDDDLDALIMHKLQMLRNSKPNTVEEQESKFANLKEYKYDSDNDEYVVKQKSFGLVRSDGTKIPLKNAPVVNNKVKKPEPPKPVEVKKTNKKLTEEEKEELRRQMMSDAVKRDKERSENLKRHREEIEREDNTTGEFDKNFVHRELSKTQSNVKDIHTGIRSKLNNIQRSSHHMNAHFSKRS